MKNLADPQTREGVDRACYCMREDLKELVEDHCEFHLRRKLSAAIIKQISRVVEGRLLYLGRVLDEDKRL